MAHPPSQRRILESPDPPNSSSMDPTLKKHHSKQNPHHKISSTTQRHPPMKIDTLLQAKAMTVSADFDASRLVKSQHHKPRIEKQEEGSKEKVKKVASKVQQVLVGAEKKSKKKEAYGKEKDKKGAIKTVMLEGCDLKKMSISLGGVGGGRRRSFCGSQVELADFLAGSGAKVVSVDMPSFMQIHAVDCARKTYDSLEKFTSKSLALTLKKEFDGVYGPAWHCIVGTSFGSFVTHSVGGFLYFSLDQKLYVLLFKTTVQRAD